MKNLIFLGLLALSFSAKATCLDQATKQTEQIKQTEWSTHSLNTEPTVYMSPGKLEKDGKTILVYYSEWVDHTVGGDATVILYFNPKTCEIACNPEVSGECRKWIEIYDL